MVTQQQQPYPPAPNARRSRFRRALPWLVGVLVFFVGVGIGSAGGDTPAAAPTTVTRAPSAAEAEELSKLRAELDARAQQLDAREAALAPKEAAAQAGTIPGDGVYVVGQDVPPGSYATAGPAGAGRDCYYAIKDGVGSDADILDNNATKGAGRVTLKTGQVFESRRCQDWHLRP